MLKFEPQCQELSLGLPHPAALPPERCLGSSLFTQAEVLKAGTGNCTKFSLLSCPVLFSPCPHFSAHSSRLSINDSACREPPKSHTYQKRFLQNSEGPLLQPVPQYFSPVVLPGHSSCWGTGLLTGQLEAPDPAHQKPGGLGIILTTKSRPHTFRCSPGGWDHSLMRTTA